MGRRAPLIVLLAVAACDAAPVADAGIDAGADAGTDAGTDAGDAGPLPCAPGNWDSVAALPHDRSCVADSDCAMAMYHDCSRPGGRLTGVRAADAARYEAAIAACEATVGGPTCGRMPFVFFDDGTSVGYIGLSRYVPVVHCVEHVCTTGVEGAVDCGRYHCLPGWGCGASCFRYVGGYVVDTGCQPAGPDGGTSCADAPDGGRCAPGTCVDVDGGFTCTCG